MVEKCAECKKKIIMTRAFHLDGKTYCSGLCHRKAIEKTKEDKKMKNIKQIPCEECGRVVEEAYLISGANCWCSKACAEKWKAALNQMEG